MARITVRNVRWKSSTPSRVAGKASWIAERMRRSVMQAIPLIGSVMVAAATLFGIDGAARNGRADGTERIIGFRPRTYAILNARLIPRPGEVIENGHLILRDGLIVALGTDVPIPPDALTIDGKGLHVYAGFLDAAGTDLIDQEKKPEPSSGRTVDLTRYVLAATPPDDRHGLTPEFEVQHALKSDNGAIDAIRQTGVTAVHLLPTGRIASGQGALISTHSGPLRERRIAGPRFHQFQLFAMGGSRYPSTLMGATAHLRQAFLDAERAALHSELYRQRVPNVERPAHDPGWEMLQEVAEGQRKAVFSADSRDDIDRALRFAAEQGLSPILWGAKEAHERIERLREAEVPVILRIDFEDEPKVEANRPNGELTAEIKPPLRVQEDRLDRWRERVRAPQALHAAGVPFAFSSQGLSNRQDWLKKVRVAISEGLSPEAALEAMTLGAARILNVEDRLGTLEPEKLAHVVVLTGPLEDDRSKVRYLFVDGHRFEYNKESQPVTLDSENASPEVVDLSGNWQALIDSSDGRLPATFELRQDGKRLTGNFASEQGNGTVTSGSVDGETVRLVISIGAGDRSVELKFNGTFNEGELSGELKSAFGAVTKWSAVRSETEPADAHNPVDLALSDGEEQPDKNDGDGSDDRENSDKPLPPVEAQRPGAVTQTASPDEWPTELEADRLQRPFQTGGHVLIRQATVLTGTGDTLLETSILVRDGKIVAIGTDLEADDGMRVIEARGRYVMPGIIDTHSHIKITGGINEATLSIVPEVRIRDVIDTADVSEYRALAGGVTAARIFHGSANVIGGQDAVVKLKYGRPADEQILHDVPQGVKFALGENVKFRTNRFPNTRLGVEATLNRAFMEAVDYRRQWIEYERKSEAGDGEAPRLLPPRRDLRLEALADIVNHQKFIHSHCYRADEILMLLRVASNLGIRVWSLQHVLEGYKVAPEIVAHGASCSTFSDWWAYKVEAFDAVPHNAALLHEAGANVVIKSDDWELIRHLYLEAAKTVRYGNMPPDVALQTITLNAARELGIDDRMGSIEVGKDADLAIFNGHPLNSFSRCEMTLIDGEVYFARENVPSSMSVEAARRSAQPPELEFPSEEIRTKSVDLTISPSGKYALVGATVHPVDSASIPNGTLIIEDGRIAAIGKDLPLPTETKILDTEGLHIFPGLIDAGTTLGLVEIGRVRETRDESESGLFQPDLRAGVAVNPDSELIPVARSGGITSALIRPNGGILAGQASLMQLDGWTAPDMVLDYEAGLQIIWPNGNNAKKQVEQLRELLEQARLYDRIQSAAEDEPASALIADPRMDALRPYLNDSQPVFIEAHSRRQIAEALEFAEKESLNLVITGGTDAWKLARELKERNVPVIVGPVMRRPTEEYDPFDSPYANPGRLFEAGVKFCIRSDNASNSRNAPFEAAMAAAYGLPVEEALRAVTLSAAEILNVDDQLGSLSVGKLANLVIADGSLLQQTTQIKGVFIAGRPHAPVSRQTRFYDRYRERLSETKPQSDSNVTEREAADAPETGKADDASSVGTGAPSESER